MWREFQELSRAWAERREGRGGIWALQGFDFQLTSALLAMSRDSDQGTRPKVFVERLSDMVEADEGYLIVTQVKKTLGSGALSSALKELWSIDGLACEQSRDLVDRLRYRVLASARTLAVVGRAVERWRPEDGDGLDERDENALRVFKERLSVEIKPEPRMELAAHLVDAFNVDEPFRRIDEWLGRLLDAAASDALQKACERIAIDLDGLAAAARERDRRFYLWRMEDRPPSTIVLEKNPNKATLTGERPTAGDLREGRFATRPIYKTLHEQVEEWLLQANARPMGSLPVFWIAGRSGSGKSVALLHLMSELKQADDRRALIWLRGRSDRLADAVRWAQPFFAEGREVFIAIDDPYTPERQQGFSDRIDDALQNFERIRELYPDCPPPSLICCGPNEQCEQFSNDLDQIAITSFVLPLETPADIKQLSEWYSHRTGLESLPVGQEEGLLLVQLFFEWRTGQPIGEFARNFRRRLEAMLPLNRRPSAFDVVAEILALNRIYALYPAAALDARTRDAPDLGAALDRLKYDDAHFTLVPEERGIRLTHPHLANALYLTWFGGVAGQRHREAHLRHGVEAALDHGIGPAERYAPLWALGRLASARSGNELADRIEVLVH